MCRPLLAALLVFAACSQPPAPPPTLGQQQAALLAGDAPRANLEFRKWLERYLSARPEERPALEHLGAELSAARRVAMRRLIEADPRLALELALTPPERDALPASVAENVEAWRDGIGSLSVVAGIPEEGAPPPATERFVAFRGEEHVYRAAVFGRRLDELTREGLRLHGITLDDLIALTESRLRRLWPGERRPDLPVEWPSTCPVSRTQADPDLTFHGGDTLYAFCTIDHSQEFDATLAAAEDEYAAAQGYPPASAWTEGAKTILYVRVDFSDREGEPISQSAAETSINSTCNQFFDANSYGKTSMTTVVTPTLRLPRTRAEYLDGGAYVQLRTDALNAARDAGFEPNAYSNDIVAFAQTFSGWAGRGYVGSRGTWLNGSFSLRVTAHELGHNYGAFHANYWSTSGLAPIGPGSSTEYGNPFDLMGGGNGQGNHFNAWFKRRFDWLTDTTVQTVTASGTYRVQALEPTVSSGLQALRIPRDATRDYWVEHRAAINDNGLRDGVSINWGFPSNTQSQLLDMTPGDGNRTNASLIIGRTFSDHFAGIHVTPVAKPATTPASVDVVVHLGTFPGNGAPTVSLAASTTTPSTGQLVTFTATASDPDGDTLAYAWDFDDGTWGPNAATATKTFSAARAHNVRLVVSDMKGRTASASVLITVGMPTTFVLSGSVTAGGQPLPDVRITDGTRITFSNTDGSWRLANVPAGNFTLNATRLDYTFTRGFAAPLAVSADQSGLDFTAAPSPGFTLSGRVTSGGMGVAGVVVSDGSRTATSNANGDYSIPGVPSGRYTMTATLPGYGYSPSGFTNPVEVFGANVTNLNFIAGGFTVSGSIPSASVPTAPVVTDGIRSVTCTRGNRNNDPWTFTLQNVPNGTWNLVATSPGVTLTPGNFTNPLTISGASRSGLTFQVAATASFLVQGTVRTGGTPLPGVVVSDGTRSATTDSLGRYAIIGVPAGSYTVTPTLLGYTFVPTSLAVTVTNANVTGQDFNTTVVNNPPTVVTAVAATPNPVTVGTSTALTVLGADDNGEAQLTYTWNASGAFPVSFSATGTNGAKSTTATFTGAGTYTIECVITDAGGLTVRSSVTVSVQQALSGLDVTPPSANVMTGASQVFNAAGRDQFNRSMFAGTVAWAVSGGGTITGAGTQGTFVAGATPGGPFTVTATAGARSATALVTVTGTGAPVITAAASAMPNPVTGTTTVLSVRATDDAGEPALVYRWSTTQAPAPVTYSANDSNAAKDTTVTFTQAGTYDFLVTIVDGAGNMVTSVVSVTVQATPTRAEVQPAVVNLQPEQTQQFSASLFDQFDDAIVPPPASTWSVSGGGTVDPSGLFTAGDLDGGPHTLTVSFGSQSASAQITIASTPDTEPPTVAITSPATNSRLTEPTPITADATDNRGVVQVEFFVGGTTSLGVSTSPPWTATVDPATLADGTHLLTARAIDAAGNSATSAPVAITVGDGPMDLEPPTVRVLTPAANAETGLRVRVTAEAADDVGLAGVEFELDGEVVATFTAAPFLRELTVSEGAHTVVAIARDTAGKVTRSTPVPFTALAGGPSEPPTGEGPEQVLGGCGCAGIDGGALGFLALLALRRRRR
jgi:plastocyanin